MNSNKIPECSREAMLILGSDFAVVQGHITTKLPGYKPTELQWSAITLLCDEYDFTCDIKVD